MSKKRGMTPEQAEKVRLRRGIDRGTKLRIARVKKGLSQSEFAATSGISKRTIQAYEQASKRIEGAKISVLCKLSEALECKITDIMEDEELIERFNKVK